MRLGEALRDFWSEFMHRKIGILGLVMLIVVISIAISAPVIAPMDLKRWKDPSYWRGSPRGVPPIWAPYLVGRVPMLQTNLTEWDTKIRKQAGYVLIESTARFNMTSDDFPSLIAMKAAVDHGGRGAFFQISVKRPDGEVVSLYSTTIYGGAGSTGTTEVSVDATRELEVKRNVGAWLQDKGVSVKLVEEINVPKSIFADLDSLKAGNPRTLKGMYLFKIKAASQYRKFNITRAYVILGATAYGLMGTDDVGRDLFKGLVWGAPIALIIGVLVSVFSVLIGLLYGVTSGYVGATLDEIMMRIVDILMSLPKLPILIMLSIVYRPTIWTIIVFLTVFSWMGMSRVTRSIALQLRESAFVEAARSIGASRWRIVGIHIIPNIVPYAVASLALTIPDAILTEASLSFLGLGDPSLPTWGSILNDAQSSGALGAGMWWWFIPPGLAIAFVSMAFVFIGYAIDEIVNPRLRRR